MKDFMKKDCFIIFLLLMYGVMTNSFVSAFAITDNQAQVEACRSQNDMLTDKAVNGLDGSLIDAVPHAQAFTNTNRNGYWEEIAAEFDIADFWYGSLSEKAALSEKWIPIAQILKAKDPCFSAHHPILSAFTRYRYGLPDTDRVQLEAALEIAKNAVIALGANPVSYSARSVEYLYDVMDMEHPIWKISIYEAMVDKELRSKDSNLARFRVEINATTSEVENAYIIDIDMPVLDWRL